MGIGFGIKIETTVGINGNGLNLLKAFEQSNITIYNILKALPVTGVWETGDRIIKEAPTAGCVSEWVYVKARLNQGS
ncbi:MAG: hypothetical protein ACREVX_04425 [Clostridium sp.]|uniref:hypothetical protein n=1 Tax=Clostridium sp. TaxID=1506 RepID=UPI003D6CC20E